MSIRTESVYTKERLIRFNNYVMLSKKVLLSLMAIGTLLVYGCVIFMMVNGGLAETVTYSAIFLTLLDVFYIFVSFILPRFTLKKSKTLNAKITCIFNESGFDLSVTSNTFNESSTIRYPTLTQIVKNKNDIYLFIASNQAFITSVDGLREDEIEELRSLLSNSINKKDFKWN
ncbi:MAG: YcxB family protein [Clostridia bacterium]|nr:YcxB family protein [Clostridia bacterium]